jgi:hypothetical protein
MGDTNKKLSAMEHLEQIHQAISADSDSDENLLKRMRGLDQDVDELKQTMSGYATTDQVNKIMSTQRDVLTALRLIASTLGVKEVLQIQFEGELPMAPGQMSDTQTIQATAIETDAAGQPVTIDPANAAWGIDDSSIASLTQNPDGSATFKALKPGNATISLTDKATGAAGTNTLTVTSSGPNTLTISFGDPQSPTPPAPAPAGQ